MEWKVPEEKEDVATCLVTIWYFVLKHKSDSPKEQLNIF